MVSSGFRFERVQIVAGCAAAYYQPAFLITMTRSAVKIAV
jgi:hypothetical protein